MQRPKHTDSLSQQSQWVIAMSLEPGISGLTHARGALAGETRPLLSNNSFFSNPPGWEHTRSQRHGRVKRSHPASPEVACTIYADGEHGLGSHLPTEGLLELSSAQALVLLHTGLFHAICLITDKRTWPLHDLTELKADTLSPHCPPPAKIKGHLDQKEPVHTDFKLH